MGKERAEVTFENVQEFVVNTLGGDPKYTDILRRADTLKPDAVQELLGVIETLVSSTYSISSTALKKLSMDIYKTNYGLGAITDLYIDPEVGEIWVNAYDDIWVEKHGKRHKCQGLKFRGGEPEVRRVLDLMNRYDKVEISTTSPITESKLVDGSRLTALISPAMAHTGFVLRCPNDFSPTTENLLKEKTISEDMIELFELLVRGRANILVIGGTAAGKTQFMRWLLGFVRRDMHLVTLETRQELFVRSLYPDLSVMALEENDAFGIGLDLLFRTTLRLTPNIIVCGEMRSYEAEWVIHAMRRGHPGSMSSLHTNSPEFVIPDVAEMICEDGKSRDPVMLERRIANALDIVIQISRDEETGVRRVSRVSEVVKKRQTAGYYVMQDLFTYSYEMQTFLRSNTIQDRVLQAKLRQYGTGGHNPISEDVLERWFNSF